LFSIPIAIGCITEVIGYVGRILSYNNPFSQTGFLMQICCITIAPAFYSAAIYFTIGDIVRRFGVDASRLRPDAYAYVFIPCDIMSLVLQATGGGLASVAAQSGKKTSRGTHIMVAGLAFQVFSLSMFIALTLEFLCRVRRQRTEKVEKNGTTNDDLVSGGIPLSMSEKRLVLFSSFLSLAVIGIFIRCVFRVIELSQGWSGSLIKDEVSFIALEGV
jgi:hypothetical protein